MIQTAKRLDHIDIAKAIGLLLVIYGHTFRMSMRAVHPWCAFSYTFVYRFHVPLLYFLSGMGCTLTAQKNRSLSARQFLHKKVHSLLLPWGVYAAFLYLLFYLANRLPPVRALLTSSTYQLRQPAEYLWLVLRNENPYGFHLWYLPTLFWFVLMAWLLDKYLSPAAARAAKLALVVALPVCYQLFFVGWFWTVKSYFQQGAFFFLGCVLPREKAEQHAKPLVLAGALCGFGVVWEVLSPAAVWPDGLLAEILCTWADYFAVSGFFVGIWAACVLLQKPLRWLIPLGKNSMLFYLYHQPFCCAVLGLVLYDKLGVSAGGTVLACGAASLVMPYLFFRLAGRLRLRPLLRRLGLPG